MKNKLKIFSGFYSLVLLSVFCFRDIHWCDETKIINESFLKFIVIHSMTGEDLAAAIISGNIINKYITFFYKILIFFAKNKNHKILSF